MACRFACSKNHFLSRSFIKNVFDRNASKHMATWTSSHNESDILPVKDHQHAFELASLSTKGFLRSAKEYNPPPNVREKVFGVCAEFLNLKNNHGHGLESTSLTDRTLRFKILTKCISEFGHDISNSQLYMITTVGDLIDYFSMPVKTTNSLEDFKNGDGLPPNLHAQQEYIRFNPETDTMFGGVTAFPGSSTIVTGLKARKKYKGFKADFNPFKPV